MPIALSGGQGVRYFSVPAAYNTTPSSMPGIRESHGSAVDPCMSCSRKYKCFFLIEQAKVERMEHTFSAPKSIAWVGKILSCWHEGIHDAAVSQRI